MASEFKLQLTEGLIGGMTVQFSEGAWPGEIGDGIAMTDEAFEIVEPLLQATAPSWTPVQRYGVFELTPPVRSDLTKRLRSEAAEYLRHRHDMEPQTLMLEELATWLEARLEEGQPVSVLGY